MRDHWLRPAGRKVYCWLPQSLLLAIGEIGVREILGHCGRGESDDQSDGEDDLLHGVSPGSVVGAQDHPEPEREFSLMFSISAVAIATLSRGWLPRQIAGGTVIIAAACGDLNDS